MKRTFMLSLSIMLVFSSVFMFMNIHEDTEAKIDLHDCVTYIPHPPIDINGNPDFAMQAGVEGWPGDGSPGNPYIIENYEINASLAHGIQISLTTVHFRIKDALIRDGASTRNGINFDRVENGVIENCMIINNRLGIMFSH